MGLVVGGNVEAGYGGHQHEGYEDGYGGGSYGGEGDGLYANYGGGRYGGSFSLNSFDV